MGEINVTVWFELVGADRDDFDDALASRVSRRLNEKDRGLREHRLAWGSEEGRPLLEWKIGWKLEGMATEDADAWTLAHELTQTVEKLATPKILSASLSQVPGSQVTGSPYLLLPKLSDARLVRARLEIPLRYDDGPLLESDPGKVLRALFENDHAFWADIDDDFGELQAHLDNRFLVLDGNSVEVLGRVGVKYLRASRRDPRSPLYHSSFILARRRPFWALASIVILLGSFVLSWLPLHYWSLGILAGGTLAAAAWALWRGSKDDRAGLTFFGLVPVLLLIVFACVYGVGILAGSGVAFSGAGSSACLREPLLLSLSLAGTVGFLDAQVSGWARSIAYLEMLLAIGYVGTAALVTARSASRRLDRAMATLLLERREAG